MKSNILRNAGLMLFLIFFLTTGAAAPGRGEDSTVLSLEEAVRLAFQNEEVLKIAGENLNQAFLENKRARGAILPDFRFTTYLGYASREFSFQEEAQEGTEYGYAFRLNQPLYTGGRARSALRATRSNIDINQYLVDLTGEDIYLMTAEAFFTYRSALQVVEASTQGVKQARDFLDLVNTRFEIGEVTRTSILRAEFDLSERENELIIARNGLNIARANLRKLIGRDFSTLKDEMVTQNIDPDETGLDYLINRALSRRKELFISDDQVDIAREKVVTAKGQFLPLISANGFYGQDGGETMPNDTTSYGGSLNLDFPIYDRGLSISDLSLARVEVTKAELQRDQLKKDIRLEVEDKYYRLKALISAVESIQKQVELAEENSRGVRLQYEVGLSTDLDVSAALFDLLSARVRLAERKVDLIMADLELLKAIGDLGIPG
jgi:outer membrane protein